MDKHINVFNEINSLAEEFMNIINQQEKNHFDNINHLCKDFMVVFDNEKQRLPYHINILDLIWANENAHSRIFTELLKQKNGNNYEILESFLNYLKTIKSNFDFFIEHPKITSEKDRIDLQILDKTYALIIENKIHNAVDQEAQIARYITKVNDKGIKEDGIFIVYLTRDGNKKPSDTTWKYLDVDYKERFKDRFIELSFRKHILLWLKDYVLPNCRIKDIFLKSTIEQYIDYLEGMFNQRKMHKTMNEELKKHIATVLKLDSTLEENISILEKKLDEILKVEEQVKSLIEENKKKCWNEWLNRLKKDFPNYEYIDYSNTEKLRKVGVILNYKDLKFSVLIEEETNIYYGIGRHNASNELIDDIKIFTKPLVDGFKATEWWYGWKYTSYNNGYERLKTLIKDVEIALKKN